MIQPKITIEAKSMIQRVVVRFSRSWNTVPRSDSAGVGWKRMFVFSPWMGTSVVELDAMGSGGAVKSCVLAYSCCDCAGEEYVSWRETSNINQL